MIFNARNPKWTDSGKTVIMLEVELENEWATFAAAPNDCTIHGPMLYNFAVNGLFGEILDSDEERIIRGELPAPEGMAIIEGKLVNIAYLEQQAEQELGCRLAPYLSAESQATAEVDEAYAQERKDKITALLAVKNQNGWPVNVEWPE